VKGKGGPVAILALHQVAHLVMDADHVAALQPYAAHEHYRKNIAATCRATQYNGKITKISCSIEKGVVKG
jgi:hypothetical protein